MLDQRCRYHSRNKPWGWNYPSLEHQPDLHCPECRSESAERVRGGKPGFFTLLQIAEREREAGAEQTLRSKFVPAQRVLDALISVCGEDIGRKKFEELVSILTAPGLDDEGEPMETTSIPLVQFLYSLVGK